VSTNSPNRAWITVHLGHLVANARAVQQAARGAALLPVVKADGYGLGAVAAARALETLNPWGFAVVTLEEAVELRDAGVGRRILVLTPAWREQRDAYAENDLRAALEDPDVAARWGLPFHVEIDTGMGRCGTRWDDVGRLVALGTAGPEGAYTHFFAADEGPETVRQQWRRFQEALSAMGHRPSILHAANSAGAWRLQEHLDLVRPGVFLYGGEHAPDLPAPRPVVTVRAPVVSVRRLHAGETVSYGGDWAAPKETVVAALGIGYADGVPRAVQGKAHVLLAGRPCTVVGRVTMDFIVIDLGPDGTDVAVGDVATVIGRDGDHEITVDAFARWSGTIGYEALTRLGLRLRREYVGG
jgi:alanine racemase